MLPSDCENKIRSLAKGPNLEEVLIELFNATISDTKVVDNPTGTLVLQMYDEKSDLKSGDYAAEIHLVVRKVE